MNVFEGIDGLKRIPPGAVMSIGNFDGLHLGHARIIQTMRSARDQAQGARLAVVTFEPHPLTVLRPELAPPRLSPPAIKRQLLNDAGIDDYVILPPTPDVLNMPAEEFWRILHEEVRAAHLVEGPTFNFGRDRRGTIEKLREWSASTDVSLTIVDPVDVALLDLQIAPASSSLIRWLLSNGRARDATICLGRTYALEGKVIGGRRLGRTIGVPTANLDCGDQLIPADGVYAARCSVADEDFAAALSIGNAPTFLNAERKVEAHLIGFSGDLYGQTLQVKVVDWLRDQMRFNGIEALKVQIAIDLNACRDRLADCTARRNQPIFQNA